MIRLILAVLIFSFSTGFAISVPSSGIDWESSFVRIEHFDSPFAENKAVFNCFGHSLENLPIEISLSELGFNSNSSGPKTLESSLQATECFQAAGEYKSKLVIFDKAKNFSEKDFYLTLEAGKLSVEKTKIKQFETKQYRKIKNDYIRKPVTDCSSEKLVANGLDSCHFALTFHDHFGNKIPQDHINKLKLSFPGVDAQKSKIKILSNTENPFRDAIRFGNGKVDQTIFGVDATSDHSYLFSVRSFAPTLKISKSDKFPLLKVVSTKLPIILNTNIEEVGVSKPSGFNAELMLQYDPWISLGIDTAWSSGKYFYSFPQTWTPLVLIPTFLSGDILPEKIIASFRGLVTKDSQMLLRSAEEKPKKIYQTLIEKKGTTQKIDLEFLTESDDLSNSVFQLLGGIVYLFKDPEYGTKLVQYPTTIAAGELLDKNLLAQWEMLTIGADIEGKVLNKKFLKEEDQSTFSFSQRQIDVRESFVRSVYNLVRGVNPKEIDVIDLDQDLVTPVFYVKGRNVRLSSAGAGDIIFSGGRKTIIIEDGNLLIDRNIKYESLEDSLGIVLINKEVNSRELGNLFINNNVKYLAGTYFLDGSVISTLEKTPNTLDFTASIKNRTLTNNENPNASLGSQLLLNGTLITRNTIGAAARSPLLDPWGDEVDFEVASRYDLNYLRRYQPTRNASNQLVPDKFNDYCVKEDGKTCDKNPHAFIIRPDGRVKAYPPPGFSQIQGVVSAL